jgi:hypothetical protein
MYCTLRSTLKGLKHRKRKKKEEEEKKTTIYYYKCKITRLITAFPDRKYSNNAFGP